MSTFQGTDTLAEMVTRCPTVARVFEEAGIDYCCGGKRTLDAVCSKKGIDAQELLATVEEFVQASSREPVVDAAAMSLTELTDHIEQTHHAYLRSEFPRLDVMTEKVASVHGGKEPRLVQIRRTFQGLVAELTNHMMKEERILFPMIRELDASEGAPAFHCGSLANPICQMDLTN